MLKRLTSILSVFAVAIAVSLTTTASVDVQPNIEEQSANYTLSGTVMDVVTEETLSGVEVTLQGEDKSATSNEEGQYSLADLEAGTYTILVEHEGYQEYSHSVEIVDGDVQHEIRLQPMMQ